MLERPWEFKFKAEDLIQTEISDKDENKVSSIVSTPATGLWVNREIRKPH